MKVLIITSHDYGWGIAAATFLRDFSSKIEAVSASRYLSDSRHPLVIEAMHECLIRIEDEETLPFSEVNTQSFNKILDIDDDYPCPSSIDEAREIRDRIKNTFFIWLRSQGKID